MKHLLIIIFLYNSITVFSQELRKSFVDSLLTNIEIKKDIRYNTFERPLLLDIYYPQNMQEELLPCVVWIHGGGLVEADLDKNYDLIRWGAARTASEGYISVSIDYRLITERPLPVAMQDCMTAIRFLKSKAEKYRIDTTRIAIVGESAGGYLAGLCSFTCNTNIFSTYEWNQVSNDFTCGVLWYPAINHWPYNMLDYISPNDIPVISIHGDNDGIVSINQSFQIQNKCKEKELDFKLYTIQGADHGFFKTKWDFDKMNKKYTEQAIEITIDFLDKKLKSKKERDDTDFKTIKIGNQTWMAEDLAIEVGEGCWCYNNKAENCEKFGRLYNWEAALKAADQVPGWHLPSDEEWEELTRYISMQENDTLSNVGFYLKAKKHWSMNGNGSDKYGFSAIPGGQKDSLGIFDGIDYYGHWWSSSEVSSSKALFRYTYSDMTVFDNWTESKKCGFTVRLIKDK